MLPRTERRVVRRAAEVTRHSEREVIQSKLMRNEILITLLMDLMVKYATKATLDQESQVIISLGWLAYRCQ